MTIKTSIIVAATVTAGAAMVSAFNISEYRKAPDTQLNMPVVPDSAQKENKFAADRLLSARAALDFRQFSQDWTTVQTDSAGRLQLVRASGSPRLTTFITSVRPQRYVKGKFRLNSNVMTDVLVDGKSVIKKTTSDSLPADSEASFEMNPESDHLVQLNMVALPDDKTSPDFSLEFIPDEKYDDVVISASASPKRRFSVRTASDGPRSRYVNISPDGKYMLVSYNHVYDADNNSSYTELRETATGKLITSDMPSAAAWMPKGASVFYSLKRNGKYDLYKMDIPSMKSELLAPALPDNSFSFTPDGDYIIYYEEIKGATDDGPLKRVEGPDDRIPGNRDRYYLVRYDLKQRVADYLTFAGATTSICDFSRDGKKLLYLSSVNIPSEFPFYFSDLIEMDLKTLRTDTLVRHDGAINNAVYSPDGSKLFVTGGPSAFGDLGKNAGEHKIANDFDVQGYLFDIAARKATPLTKDFDPSIESGSIVWNPKNNTIYFRAAKGFFTPIYSLDPKNGKFTKLATNVDTATSFTIGDEEDKWMGYVGQSFTNVGTAFLLNLKTGDSKVINDPMKPYLEDIAMGDMRSWLFTASDGTKIDGMVCLPPDFDPMKKYPLIVYYYGGTTPSTSTMHHPYTPQLFASRDYVVYVVNPSGTIGYGQEFSARHVNAWGKRTADDIIEGVKEFCRQHPFVNDKKIGCLGASYGGFMTQYLQTQTDIFAAAVSHAGISNVTSYWGEGFWGYSYNAVAAAESYPWSDPELFTKQGSLFNADKIHTPLLLLHGTEDTNVPIGESIQLFNALRVLGRDVEFITVDGQNHIITDYNKRQIWQNTIMAWFAKYLQDDPRWWNSMYGDK